MTHKQKRILFNWLHKQGALHRYKKARYAYSHQNCESFRSYAQLSFGGAIIAGFDWSLSLEGAFYWVDINVAWREFLQKNDT
jgi:hypothetical protein